MTDPSEVVVSDEDIDFVECVMLKHQNLLGPEMMRQALAAFIAKRVPDAIDARGKSDTMAAMVAGHNACRAKVLRGEE